MFIGRVLYLAHYFLSALRSFGLAICRPLLMGFRSARTCAVNVQAWCVGVVRHRFICGSAVSLDGVIQHIQCGIVVVDRFGVVVSFNSAASRILGTGSPVRVGVDLKSGLKDTHPEFDAWLTRYDSDRRPVSCEWTSGSRVIAGSIFELAGSREYDPGAIVQLQDITELRSIQRQLQHQTESLEDTVSGRTADLRESNKGLVHEIDERKQVEEALRVSEHFLQNVFDAIQDGISVLGTDLTVIRTNRWMEQRYADQMPITGQKCYQAYQRRRSPCPWCPSIPTIATGQATTETVPYPCADNPSGWIELTAFPIKDEHGRVRSVIEHVKDITARKRAEDALIESETRYRQLFNSVLEGICVVDENETIKYVNPAFLKIFGEDSASDVLENSILDYFSEGQRDIIRMQTEKRRTGGSSQYELELTTRDGSKKQLLVSATPRFNKDNEYAGVFGTILDITETKRLRELESRAERLETAGIIAGQVAHDFNNLLAPMIAYPGLARDELPHDHKVLAFLDDIESAARKMADVNQDLLTMGRRGHYSPKVLDLNEVVRPAAQEMALRSNAASIELELCDDLMKIKGGSAQIHRALTNLIANAQDAVPDGGRITIMTENLSYDKPPVAFGRMPASGYVRLTVSDTGCGIPDDIAQNIFDPFFSTKATDGKRGTGLGLAIVDAVMKDHGGYVDFKTCVGRGTSFYLYFPIAGADARDGECSEPAGGKETVLVVDDDEIQRRVTAQLLSKLGYKVTCVESGERALEVLRGNVQDLVILDMAMSGGIDGAETYRRILEFSPHQKAIILSGFSDSSRVLAAQKLGAGAFVRKPVAMHVIAAAVREELDRNVKAPTF